MRGGLATVMSEVPGHATTDGISAFTTAYASPEQLRGEPVSTATDCEQPPPPPSSVATPAAAVAMDFGSAERLGKTLCGELDAIVLMALRKEPDRRYLTAAAMGDDLRDYLRGFPCAERYAPVWHTTRRRWGFAVLAFGPN